MSRTERPYVRVYYVDLQRDYPDIYADKPALGLWLTLLVTSDLSWPVAPELPASLKRADLAKLTGCGLVELVTAHRYRIKGYAVERGKRQDAARAAADKRWQSAGNADAHADALQPHSGRSADAMPRAGSSANGMPRPRPSTETESKDQQDRAPETARGPWEDVLIPEKSV